MSDVGGPEIPPPVIIKIEDLTPADSPYATLATNWEKPESVAVVRLDSPSITGQHGNGHLVGNSLVEITEIIDLLAGTHGQTSVKSLEFVHSVDIQFVTTGEVTEALSGATSKEMRGAEMLTLILRSRQSDGLAKLLNAFDESVVSSLAALLKLLIEYSGTLDIQTPRAKPVRVTPTQAQGLYLALKETSELPPDQTTQPGVLVGVISDTRDFKLRLDYRFRGKEVIDGKYLPALDFDVEQCFKQQVIATLSVEELRSKWRKPHLKFTLVDVQLAPGAEPLPLPES